MGGETRRGKRKKRKKKSAEKEAGMERDVAQTQPYTLVAFYIPSKHIHGAMLADSSLET